MDKSLRITLIATMLIVSLSLAFYFAVFLPSKARRDFDFKKALQIENQEKQAECIDSAIERNQEWWVTECEGLGKKSDCSLPWENVKRMDGDLRSEKELCLKRFPNIF